MFRKSMFSNYLALILDDAMKRRVAVQYTITEKYGQKESKKILRDAKNFVNKISDIISE